MTSLPSLVNVGALLMLLFLIYGVAGMDLFGELDYGEFIDENTNFKSFYNAVITLFRASTGESWNGIMHDSYRKNCDNARKCGSPFFAIPFWLSFNVIASFVFLNIFIAVILENFSNISEEDGGIIELCPKDLRKFEKTWSRFAPYGEHFINTKYLPTLLEDLEAPLGFKG